MSYRFLLVILFPFFSFSAQAADYSCHFPAQWPVSYVISPAEVGGSITRIDGQGSNNKGVVERDDNLLPGEAAFDFTIKNFLSKNMIAGVPDHLWPQVTRIRELQFQGTSRLFLIFIGGVQIGGMYWDPYARVRCVPDSVVSYPEALSVAVSPAKPQISFQNLVVDGVTRYAPWFNATYEYINNSATTLTINTEVYQVWASTSQFQVSHRTLNPPIVLKPGEAKISTTTISGLKNIDPGSTARVVLEIEGLAGENGFRPVYGRLEHRIQ